MKSKRVFLVSAFWCAFLLMLVGMSEAGVVGGQPYGALQYLDNFDCPTFGLASVVPHIPRLEVHERFGVQRGNVGIPRIALPDHGHRLLRGGRRLGAAKLLRWILRLVPIGTGPQDR